MVRAMRVASIVGWQIGVTVAISLKMVYGEEQRQLFSLFFVVGVIFWLTWVVLTIWEAIVEIKNK